MIIGRKGHQVVIEPNIHSAISSAPFDVRMSAILLILIL